MAEIEVGGKHYEITEAGFLIEREAWTKEIGLALAAMAGIELTLAHWEIILFIRDYYRRFNYVPNNRVFVKAVAKGLGEDKGNTRYLYSLFPEGPLKLACKIGGLPKPTTCI
ncbi:MAG: TusE/DsrC/DsvC family sulfur relay protein [Methylococcaceae bacterium]|nr:TusE/DsrC/DsvC family sulfur relay protein [Methylococcaceae bacterium]